MIQSVETFILHVPVTGSGIADSTHSISHWGVVGVKLVTEDGVAGYGFTGTHAHLPSDRLMTAAITDCYGPLIERADETPPSAAYTTLFRRPPLQWLGRAGILQLALSAIDIALWDIFAKRRGLPLAGLVGGPIKDRLPAYNTDVGWLSISTSKLIDGCKAARDAGFRAIKIKVGSHDLRDDIVRSRELRKALGPETTIATDANGRWDLPTARRFARETEDADLLWIEEPLWYDDVEAHAELARTCSLPIALGEQIYTAESMAQFIYRRAVHFVQPDVTRIGGITGALEAAAMAKGAGLPVAFHAGDMSQVHVHLAYALPHHTMLEYIPWIASCFEEPATVKDGDFVKPARPGAGTTLTRRAMEEFRVG